MHESPLFLMPHMAHNIPKYVIENYVLFFSQVFYYLLVFAILRDSFIHSIIH